MKRPTTVSLFCGAGGESAGKELAFRDLGINTVGWNSHAVNHWDLAVAAHKANFPTVNVHCEDITEVTAASFGIDFCDMLWASPSCVNFSRARGGKPVNDQQRSHADEVVERWLKEADVNVFLMENVAEFRDWGPLYKDHSAKCPGGPGVVCIKACHYDKPIPEKKGQFFKRFLASLKKLGYRYDYRIINCADYGDPTTRKRFFLQAFRDNLPITWADPTHRNPKKSGGLFDGHLPPWRTAAECIDWSLRVPSIFGRKRPLKPATLKRIAAGLDRFVIHPKGGAKPYLVNLTHGGRVEDLGEPFTTLTGANRGEKAIIIPSLVGVGGRAGQTAPQGVDEPLGTVTGKADRALIAASMVSMHGTSPAHLESCSASMEDPLPALAASGTHAALCAAFLAKHYGGPNGNQTPGSSMEEPMGTVTSQDHHAVVAASLIQTGYGEREGQAPRILDIQEPLGTVVAGGTKHALVATSMLSIDQQSSGISSACKPSDEPLSTMTTKARHCLVAASLMTNTTGHAPTGIDAPVPALTTGNHQALVAGFLTKYHSTGGQWQPVDVPLHAVTSKDEFGLVTVEIDGQTYVITDIGMRMLEPHELAKAMGFPDDYRWVNADGKPLSKKDRVKMIGNACPVNTVSSIIKEVVRNRPHIFGVAREAVA